MKSFALAPKPILFPLVFVQLPLAPILALIGLFERKSRLGHARKKAGKQ